MEKRRRRSSKPIDNSGFRSDIAGLRGAAVLVVTLCHFGIPGFAGGFIGPDIFFVLSGYLITGILYREFTKNDSRGHRAKRISFKNFYVRRSRRILPASIAVVIVVNIYARFSSSPAEIAQITADSKWTLLFAANINFMRQATDYFAQSLAVSPLQHYWSLSVEEQFYFVWPILLLWAASIKKLKIGDERLSLEKRLLVVFSVVSVVSFWWMLFEFSTNPTASYFSTFSRTWELAFGGLLSVVRLEFITKKLGTALPIIRAVALVALFGSLAVVTPTNFGYTLVIPTIATGILLVSAAARQEHDFVYRIMSFRGLTSIGTISYSVYLWHWPIAVVGRQNGYFENIWQNLIGVGLALLFGMIGYYLIERPFLRIKWDKVVSVSKSRRRKKKKSVRLSKLQQSPVFNGALVTVITTAMAAAFYLQTPSSSAEAAVWVPPASAQLFAPVITSDTNVTQGNNQQASTQAIEKAKSDWQEKVMVGLDYVEVPANLDPSFAESMKLAQVGGWTPCVGMRKDDATLSEVCESVPAQSEGTKTAILLGDSHARIFWEAITASLDLNKWHVILLGMPSCPVPKLELLRVSKYNKDCDKHRELTMQYVEKEKPDLIFVSDAKDSNPTTGEFISAYDVALSRLVKATKDLILFETSPGTSKLLSCLRGQKDLTACPAKPYKVDVLRKAQRNLAQKYGVGYWDSSAALCAPKDGQLKCPPIIGNMAVSGDGGHILPKVSKGIAPYLIEVLLKMNIPHLASI